MPMSGINLSALSKEEKLPAVTQEEYFRRIISVPYTNSLKVVSESRFFIR
jgi:hypothetical protein